MDIRLGEAELRLMDFLWNAEKIKARELALLAKKEVGWEKNTTYTMLKRLIDKGAIHREEPDFICTPLIKKSDIRRQEVRTLLNTMFDGSAKLFVKTLINEQELSEEEIEEIKNMIENHK